MKDQGKKGTELVMEMTCGRASADLIAALIDEGRISEARESIREFSVWDKGGLITVLQRVLLRLSPRHYNYISRECLYRMEWHGASIVRKLKGA